MRLRGIILIGAVISIIVGFTLGRAVIADSPEPGSEQDPLVTQSYADKKIQERVTDLEKVVSELTVQARLCKTQLTIYKIESKIRSQHPTLRQNQRIITITIIMNKIKNLQKRRNQNSRLITAW